MSRTDQIFGCLGSTERAVAMRRMGVRELFDCLADLLEARCECDDAYLHDDGDCWLGRLRLEVAGHLRRGPWG